MPETTLSPIPTTTAGEPMLKSASTTTAAPRRTRHAGALPTGRARRRYRIILAVLIVLTLLPSIANLFLHQ